MITTRAAAEANRPVRYAMFGSEVTSSASSLRPQLSRSLACRARCRSGGDAHQSDCADRDPHDRVSQLRAREHGLVRVARAPAASDSRRRCARSAATLLDERVSSLRTLLRRRLAPRVTRCLGARASLRSSALLDRGVVLYRGRLCSSRSAQAASSRSRWLRFAPALRLDRLEALLFERARLLLFEFLRRCASARAERSSSSA